jgi:hypothetical protein
LLAPRARIASLAAFVVTGLLAASVARAADPPVPSGGHPRLFMSQANVAAFAANVGMSGTLAADMVADCQRTIDKPSDYVDRGGVDAFTWPLSALSCAFAYATTQQAKYMTPALLYWKASLNDDQKIGDGLGCSPANANFNWKAWNGNDPAPPNLLTTLHDTGYPIRWYGPFISLVYDWLYNAPGVDDALRTQTRTCLTGWIDYYSMKGYHHDEIASNYNAGFFLGKVLAAIAIGNDGGADGHLWTETLATLFSSLMVGKGLMGSAGGVGQPAGAMVGGDWGEGWQYGPLSVLEYAVAARAVEEAGAPQPDVDAWVNSLIVRYIHGTVPSLDGIYVGNGDFDSEMIYQSPSAGVLDAVLAGPSSDQAAAWAASMKQLQEANQGGSFWNVLAELRKPAPQDYRMQSPAPPLWYLARGTRAMYVRTSWDASAFWGVFASAPKVNTDHQHFAASNFVFNRGGDALIVDPSNRRAWTGTTARPRRRGARPTCPGRAGPTRRCSRRARTSRTRSTATRTPATFPTPTASGCSCRRARSSPSTASAPARPRATCTSASTPTPAGTSPCRATSRRAPWAAARRSPSTPSCCRAGRR